MFLVENIPNIRHLSLNIGRRTHTCNIVELKYSMITFTYHNYSKS